MMFLPHFFNLFNWFSIAWNSDSRLQEYKGEFCDGLMNGDGMLLWKDGTQYVGNFSGGLINGFGRYKILFECRCKQKSYLLQ